MKTNKSSRAGFTLIELLTVIAIIGILAAILIPTIGSVRKQAAKTASGSNMKQISVSFATFSNSGTRTKVITEGAWSPTTTNQAADQKEWAKVLAYNAGLNDAGLYFVDSDEDVALAATLPRSIGIRSGTEYTESSDWSSMDTETISYVLVVNMSPNAPASTTPLLWTKGLESSGEWTTTSPWQGEGGHIAFMDGHVEYFDNLTADENKLAPGSGSGQTEATSDINDAIQTTSKTTTYPTI